MTNYAFNYESLEDRIRDLEREVEKIRDLEYDVERLKQELIETDNTLYETMIKLDRIQNPDYNLDKFTLGDA